MDSVTLGFLAVLLALLGAFVPRVGVVLLRFAIGFGVAMGVGTVLPVLWAQAGL